MPATREDTSRWEPGNGLPRAQHKAGLQGSDPGMQVRTLTCGMVRDPVSWSVTLVVARSGADLGAGHQDCKLKDNGNMVKESQVHDDVKSNGR